MPHARVTVVSGACRDRVAYHLEHPRPPLDRAPELVGAAVVERREELIEELGVGRGQLDAVVPGLACPRRHLAEPHRHRPYLVRGHYVDGNAGEDRPEHQWQRAHGEDGIPAPRRVGLVPRLHRVQAAVADLQEDRGALGVHRLDHGAQRQHPLTGVHQRHPRRGAALFVDARVALHDQPDALPRVLDEVLGVGGGRVGAGAGAFEDRRAVEAVANRRRSDAKRCPEHAHVPVLASFSCT